jgi:ATP-dependent DNA ligase
MHIHDMLCKIALSKGKEKIEVIKSFVEEPQIELFKRIVRMAYQQGVAYHLTEVPVVVKKPLSLFALNDAPKLSGTLEQCLMLLDELNTKGGCNAADKALISSVYSRLSTNDQTIIDLILRRNLRCGASLSSFNKVFGDDFCPLFPKMLCESYNEKKIAKNIKFPAYSQLKSDGARAQKVPVNSVHYTKGVYSRGGEEFKMIGHIQKDCETIFGDDFTVDGELVVLADNGEILPRSIGNGILNKCIKGTAKLHEYSRVRFCVWDIIPIREWDGEEEATTTTKQRWEMLNDRLASCNVFNSSILLTECRVVNNIQEARAHYQEMVVRGLEGTILKSMDGVWCDKRTSTQFKFKEEFDADFKITGWYYGNKGTKYETLIGGFTFESLCGKVAGRCGGGLSDDDRKLNGDEWVGKCMEIQYNARSLAEGRDTWALSHSRCLELRFDKSADEANTLEEIIAAEYAVRALAEGE